MKILNIIQRYSPAIGGSEKWCEDVSKYISSRGCIVKVLTADIYNIEEFYLLPDPNKTAVRLGRLEYDGAITIMRSPIVRLRRIHHQLFGNPLVKNTIFDIFLHSPFSPLLFLDIIRETRKSDIVHLHTLPYSHNLIGFFFAKLFKKKIVVTPYFHIGHPEYEREVFYRLMRNCDAVLTLSDFEKRYFVNKGIRADRIFNIGSSIDIEQYDKSADLQGYKEKIFEKYNIIEGKTKVIIFIGVSHETKGIQHLIPAVLELRKEGEDIRLFLVGARTHKFENYYNNLTLLDKLTVVDFGEVPHKEKVDLLHLSDLLVLPSEFESFGIVFLEAWNCNKPVIGTENGPMPEIIGAGGLVCRYADIRDLKEKIRKILHDRSLGVRLAEAGNKKLMENYTPQKVGTKVLDVYNLVKRKCKKRVLIVSHLFPPYILGGSEIVAFEQSRELLARGYDVKVFCGRQAFGKRRFAAYRENGPFDITRVNLAPQDFRNRNYANYNKDELQSVFKDAIAEFAPDVVHFHNIYPFSVKMVDTCALFNIPAVMTLHDYWPVCFKNIMVDNNGRICKKNGIACIGCKEGVFCDNDKLSILSRNFLFKSSLSNIQRFISPSKYLAQVFTGSGFDGRKFRVVNNGIDIGRFRSIRRHRGSKVRFAFVGSILPHKGVDNLLAAIANLKNRDKISVYLVGKGDMDFIKYCRYIIKRFSLDNTVRLTGAVDNRDIHRIYRNIDALILPSLWPENCPVSIMEAMACRVPVLASNIGGIGELVKDGFNGMLFEYNDVDSLARCMERIIDNPALIERMGNNGFNEAQKFDLKSQTNLVSWEYENLFRSEGNRRHSYRFILYQGKPENMLTKGLFEILRKYEKSLNMPLDICLSELVQEGLFEKSGLLILPHYWAGKTESELGRAFRSNIPILLNEEDPGLRKFIVGSRITAYQFSNYPGFASILDKIYA